MPRESYWKRRARKKEIDAQYKQKTKLEKRAYKDALKANERACKNFLAAYKRSNPSDYKRMNARCKREMAENRKWCKLILATEVTENEYSRLRERGQVDGGELKGLAYRAFAKAAEKMGAANTKFHEFMDNLRQRDMPLERQEQIEDGDLSFVSAGNFQRTTVQEIKDRLRAANPQITDREIRERERQEAGSQRTQTTYNAELDIHGIERERDGREDGQQRRERIQEREERVPAEPSLEGVEDPELE